MTSVRLLAVDSFTFSLLKLISLFRLSHRREAK
jgi:hypothetical protein